MKESKQQEYFVNWCKWKNILIYAIPNGIYLPTKSPIKWKIINKQKREGLKKGVPDLFMPEPVGKYHGCYIEMKINNNKLTKEQLEWKERLENKGYYYIVAYGSDEAIEKTEEYFNL